ncbi:MAG: YbjQ family protein [Myxococcales bacterium]|nr:YbjQ family protein [Myxococcales bacterium]
MTEVALPNVTESAPYRIGAERAHRVVVTTGLEVPGARVAEVLGLVRGLVVRTPNIGAGIVGSFRMLAGGNIPEFSKVCEEARHLAYVQMVEHAESLGANAIIGMRYDATEFMSGATEVLAYGTAVRVAVA